MASLEYAPIQLRMAKRFVRDLLASEASRPENKLSEAAKAVLPNMVRTNFGMTAVRIIYGIDIRDAVAEAEYVDVPERVLFALTECGTPGRFLVDFFPWSQSSTQSPGPVITDYSTVKYFPAWFPGANFQHFAQESKAAHIRMRNSPVEVTKAQIVGYPITEQGPVWYTEHIIRLQELVRCQW
jgi:hypothetical protein